MTEHHEQDGSAQGAARPVRALADLARDVPTSRDLWPAIEAAIREPERAPLPASPQWFGDRRLALGLAAAIALVAVGLWAGRVTAPVPLAVAPAGGNGLAATSAIPAAFQPDARFMRTRAALLVEAAAQLAALPPESRTKVEASLETIRKARDEIQSELGRDPGNALLQALLVNAYEDEMRVLATVQAAGLAHEET
jgi:hypothetical protein